MPYDTPPVPRYHEEAFGPPPPMPGAGLYSSLNAAVGSQTERRPLHSLSSVGLRQSGIDALVASNRDLINLKQRPTRLERETAIQRNQDYIDVLKAELDEISRNKAVGLQERMAHISGLKDLNGHMKRERNMRRQERKLKKMKRKRKNLMEIIEHNPPHHFNGPYPPGFHPWTQKVKDPYADAKQFKAS
jgi:hypothetical protein